MIDVKAIREAIERGDLTHGMVYQLLDENAMLSKQKKNVMEAYNEQKEEIRSLRAGYISANAKLDEELYFWEPYAENHLETLTGGVVIRAEWIRQLIAEAVEAQAKEIERLRIALHTHESYDRTVCEMQEEIEQLKADKAALVEAVEFYADGRTYGSFYHEDHGFITWAEYDTGERARAVLKRLECEGGDTGR